MTIGLEITFRHRSRRIGPVPSFGQPINKPEDIMKSHRLSIPAAAAAALALLPLAGPAIAQGLPPQSSAIAAPIPLPEAVTIHAKITAINPQTREITLAGANGAAVTLTAGHLVDLSRLKVGDTVNAKYYRSVAFLISAPGSAAPENDVAAAAAQNVQAPGGDILVLTRISATVVGIDLAAHSIDLVDPSGGAVRTIVVTDPSRIALLPQLNVGDTITAVVSQLLAVSVDPAPKSWF
jgi:hypothetical protein